MQYDVFVERVADKAGIARDEAEQTSIAVLQELCDRLTGDEAYDLLSQLPAKLKTAEAVSSGEFQDVLEQLDPEYADFLA